MAAGCFIGALPLYGLHLPLCALVCLPLRLDLVTAYVAAHISNPLLAAPLLVAEVNVGAWLLTGEHAAFDAARAQETGIAGFAAQAALGAVVVGAVLAALAGLVGFVVTGTVQRRAASAARRSDTSKPDR